MNFPLLDKVHVSACTQHELSDELLNHPYHKLILYSSQCLYTDCIFIVMLKVGYLRLDAIE